MIKRNDDKKKCNIRLTIYYDIYNYSGKIIKENIKMLYKYVLEEL